MVPDASKNRGTVEGTSGGSLRVLLVEDDPIVRETVSDALEDAGHSVIACSDACSAEKAIASECVDLMLTDVRLPDGSGLALFRKLRIHQPSAAAMLMTAFGRVEDAVAVMREGARDYITKPFEIEDLLDRVSKVSAELSLRKNLYTRTGPGVRRRLEGESPAINLVRRQVETCAQSDGAVLITGETGTGKELCARTIHELSRRSRKPFVAVNCAALPETLAESELFGHVKGAFTGAERTRRGRFLAADGGTLFLDEIGSISAALQAKLLRAIELGTFEPVGSSESRSADVRIIAATNEDLAAAVERGTFRRDLYFRLCVFEVEMPPLRSRRADIPLLLASFLDEFCARLSMKRPQVSPEVLACLLSYDYPGNVRELMHIVEHALAAARGGDIMIEHLPSRLLKGAGVGGAVPEGQPESLSEALSRFEREYVTRVLRSVGGKRTEAARVLGISRKSLWQKLKEWGEG